MIGFRVRVLCSTLVGLCFRRIRLGGLFGLVQGSGPKLQGGIHVGLPSRVQGSRFRVVGTQKRVGGTRRDLFQKALGFLLGATKCSNLLVGINTRAMAMRGKPYALALGQGGS